MLENEKIDFNSYFKNDLFCGEDLDLVCEKIEKNIPSLLGNSKYSDIDDKLLELNTQFQSCLSDEQRKLFKKYLSVRQEATNYQNCLAYYIGVKAGLTLGKIN